MATKNTTYYGNELDNRGSIQFNGINKFMYLNPTWSLPHTNWTQSFWIKKPDSTINYFYGQFIAGLGAYSLCFNNTNFRWIYLAKNGVGTVNITSPNNTYLANVWHNIIITKSSASVFNMYINNVLIGSVTLVMSSFQTKNGIGGTVNATGNALYSTPFNGKMCHVRGWNTVLTSGERAVIMSTKNPNLLADNPASGNLVFWNRLDKTEVNFPTLINDATGNGNTYTPVNMVLGDLTTDYPT